MDENPRALARQLTTVPNLLSLSRLPLAVLVVLTLSSPLRYVFFALLVLSDGVDGWVARRLDQTTELGALLDPVLDKTVSVVLFAVLFVRVELAAAYLIFFFARDGFTVALGALAPLFGVPEAAEVKARPLGKLVTNLQFFTLVGLLVPALTPTRVLLWALGMASALAIADYSAYLARVLNAPSTLQSRPAVVGYYALALAAFAATGWLFLGAEFGRLLGALGQ